MPALASQVSERDIVRAGLRSGDADAGRGLCREARPRRRDPRPSARPHPAVPLRADPGPAARLRRLRLPDRVPRLAGRRRKAQLRASCPTSSPSSARWPSARARGGDGGRGRRAPCRRSRARTCSRARSARRSPPTAPGPSSTCPRRCRRRGRPRRARRAGGGRSQARRTGRVPDVLAEHERSLGRPSATACSAPPRPSSPSWPPSWPASTCRCSSLLIVVPLFLSTLGGSEGRPTVLRQGRVTAPSGLGGHPTGPARPDDARVRHRRRDHPGRPGRGDRGLEQRARPADRRARRAAAGPVTMRCDPAPGRPSPRRARLATVEAVLVVPLVLVPVLLAVVVFGRLEHTRLVLDAAAARRPTGGGGRRRRALVRTRIATELSDGGLDPNPARSSSSRPSLAWGEPVRVRSRSMRRPRSRSPARGQCHSRPSS